MRVKMRFVVLSALLLCSPLLAEHAKGRVYLSPVIGHWMAFDDYNLMDDGALWGARLGIDLSRYFAIEALGLYGPSEISPDDAAGRFSMKSAYSGLGIGAKVNLTAGRVVPFLSASVARAGMHNDMAVTSVNGYAVDLGKSESKTMGVFGGGLEIFLSNSVALRFDAYDHLFKDFVENDYFGDKRRNNVEFGAGLTFLFGGGGDEEAAPEPAPAPQPVRQQAPQPAPQPVAPADSDGDGVTDDKDNCPGTPAGVRVNSEGCPLDTDGDGVTDDMDKCPGTPAGVQVDNAGCPRDSDGDGVQDHLDNVSRYAGGNQS